MTGNCRRAARLASSVFLIAVAFGAVCAPVLAPWPYERQFREVPNAPPSPVHLLGTDELGRDTFSRLLYGTRTSLLLAPAAAVLAVAFAAAAGGIAALARGPAEAIFLGAADLTLCLPWLFLLLTVRALLPLDVSPGISVCITFALLGVLGWAGPSRIIRAATRELASADFVLAARGRGVPRTRIFLAHVLPNLRPVLSAQFWTSIPVFILAEANLGLLGLGVAEPLPSWGTLLRDLESQVAGSSHLLSHGWLLAPAATLFTTILAFHLLFGSEYSR